jgi:hypothetical protein
VESWNDRSLEGWNDGKIEDWKIGRNDGRLK